MGKGWKKDSKLENAQKKGQIFTKLAREIAVAARMGGPHPEGNSRLKMAVDAAKKVSCPKDTIDRAIRKGAGLDNDSIIEELTYEGKGPFGIGVIVECQTDNKNRTVGELRNIFKRHNGSLGDTNSSAWMFDRLCLVSGTKDNVVDPEEDAIEVNANSVEKNSDGSYSFFGSPTDLDSIRTALIGRGWQVHEAELAYVTKNRTDLTAEQLKTLQELLEELDDFDDSHRIYTTL
ncbi:MAG: transcriptional regulator [Bdellovibrionales bacterium RBG_16_40_8]|nr:MAG: transcriptional regulator [Bdellovibrionales bacterium RBG_16_40_8]